MQVTEKTSVISALVKSLPKLSMPLTCCWLPLSRRESDELIIVAGQAYTIHKIIYKPKGKMGR